MKILKKYLQNRKGLKKLDTKHVPEMPHFKNGSGERPPKFGRTNGEIGGRREDTWQNGRTNGKNAQIWEDKLLKTRFFNKKA